ncbi:UDP-2,4-diacetamido-2,4,6-trideoxy-beta-L-altropyranose hydrolase [Pseudomonas sp.]|uniref:UDP-2,4-diacetamido-2,4, 6-trideoxy-beta-L-altropyranose hydrolase n=1 Tax=Pseudomonas sp. TaxID=306 RepID=UPI002BD0DF81|nr:UDP-2,4-diacetamido-2,4,6-trideoxy-beta-L-altropyranose hydrolase [Pseudomonas sp.]HUE91256.1 UDP-2,4-diacetamido-2,4,6-trideoxy-beta-L-altropyranose hydrolase [Pseudomonas sp.]
MLMKCVFFRVDASLLIGSGHVMRCLTLATVLREQGLDCRFICREHAGNLIEAIREQGFVVELLSVQVVSVPPVHPTHVAWLGATQVEDAAICAVLLQAQRVDLLVVDHYALDYQWEAIMRPYCQCLLVIDDLADREHDCDVLLDQNLGRQAADYAALVPPHCRMFIGTAYALLRPEFSQWRAASLQRRISVPLRRLLISMGGADKDNVTSQILRALQGCALPAGCNIEVILGSQSPWLEAVRTEAQLLPWVIEVVQGVNDMAERMSAADLAIGAAGSTSWERCCLGLPALLLVIAANQYPAARALEAYGAVSLLALDELTQACPTWFASLAAEPARLTRMSQAAAGICSGAGVFSFAKELVGSIP